MKSTRIALILTFLVTGSLSSGCGGRTGLPGGEGEVDAGDGVQCTTPPAPICTSATRLRRYEDTGTLTNGTCAYAYAETACAPGCSDGICSVSVDRSAIAAGYGHSCAVVDGGAVKCWGDDTFGQLGNDSTTESHVPVPVEGLSLGVVAVSAGGNHTCALTFGGAVSCWGTGSSGELGNNANEDSHVPVPVAGLSSGIVAISAGFSHTCALTSSGAVVCWGNNQSGELGNDDSTDADSHVPVSVAGLSSGVVAIAAGAYFTCALTSVGEVSCWGNNGDGQLGNDSAHMSHVPVPVAGLPAGIVTVAAGFRHTCALDSGDQVWCWGNGGLTGFGIGGGVPTSVPDLPSNVVALSVGNLLSCALLSGGAVWCWGDNAFGQLGNDITSESPVPVLVPGLSSGVVAVALGDGHTCVRTESGGIKCLGSNNSGELGNDSTSESYMVVDVVGY